jgi:hypothetical protein
MPLQAALRRNYRTAKFGSWVQPHVRDAQVAAASAKEGIAFAFDRLNCTPNTLDAHRLICLALLLGVQDAVVERVFPADFEEGLDLNEGHPKSLAVSGVTSFSFNWVLAFLEAVTPAMMAEAIWAGSERCQSMANPACSRVSPSR